MEIQLEYRFIIHARYNFLVENQKITVGNSLKSYWRAIINIKLLS